MADFSAKQFQELNEAYVSMYRTEEVVEEVVEATQEEVIEEVVEATQEEVVEEVEELDENRNKRGSQLAAQRAERAKEEDKLYRAGGGDAKMRQGPQGSRRRFGGAITRADVIAQGKKNLAAKADTPAPTPTPTPAPTPTPKPTPAPEPKAEVQTREIKKPAGGAERRTPTMAELRAAQAARAAGKSEKDVVKAGVAAGKPKVSARTLPTPPPPVKKKSRLDTALSGIGKFKEAYDVVLEYLLSGGHAETVEEAHYIMLRLEEDHIQEIVEDRNRKPFSDAGEYPMRDAMRDAGMNRAPHAPVKKASTKKKPSSTNVA